MRRKGFTELTPVQRSVVETLSDGRDLLISSQTGSGKTVALGLSMASDLIAAGPERGVGPSVLVITPTRELANQVQKELGWLYSRVKGVSVAVVTGGTSIGLERGQLSRGPRVVVGTPGRMLDHIRNKAIDCTQVKEVVLDEADQMLDMGFREELEGILDQTPKERRTHLISATFAPGIRKLAQKFQRDPVHIEGTRLGDANQDIEHLAHLVYDEERYAALVNLLLLTGNRRTLIFVNTRAAAAEIAQKLFGDGFTAMPLSGELVQAQRTRTLEAFRSGAIKVLVATDVAARGLDIPDVGTVIHAAPPDDSEAYVHRSGRTGRAGRKGRCVMLVTPRSRGYVQRILREAKVRAEWVDAPTAQKVESELASLEKQRLSDLVESPDNLTPDHLEHAKQILQDRDPTEVVAALLAASRAKGICKPMNVEPVKSRGNGPRPRFEKPGFSKPRFAKNGFKKGRSRNKEHFNDGAQFEINMGFRQGANPSRLVAMICRRGKVTSKVIGPIQIDAHQSSFAISQVAAQEFEKLASRPDARDPKTRIRRI